MKKKLYTLGVVFYTLILKLASLFHPKAKDWVRGRRGWRSSLTAAISPNDTWIWFHCASVGEFEQGRSLIEAIREKFPEKKILLTFFSPSGYNLRKDHPLADVVSYLPSDTPANARDFMQIVQPEMGFFIKYELWINHLLEAHKQNIPLYLVSAKLRAESRFLLGPMSSLYKEAFSSFQHVYVQDELTARLLKGFTGKENISICGDTRFDRVAKLPDAFEEVPHIANFVGDSFVIVCGSTWSHDEKILLASIQALSNRAIKWIIAPHEIKTERIQALTQEFKESHVAYSNITHLTPEHTVLWIDNVGMLSRLYHYSDVVYIGGGFGGGIHNTQEPAIYGNPVAFGPNHKKFAEAIAMKKEGTAKEIWQSKELTEFITQFMDDKDLLSNTREKQRAYMTSQTGATQKVMESIFP